MSAPSGQGRGLLCLGNHLPLLNISLGQTHQTLGRVRTPASFTTLQNISRPWLPTEFIHAVANRSLATGALTHFYTLVVWLLQPRSAPNTGSQNPLSPVGSMAVGWDSWKVAGW